MKWGLIALNGSVDSFDKLRAEIDRYIPKSDLKWIIGVDGGCRILEKLEFVPNIVLGDFDSIGSLQWYKNLWPTADIKMFPTEKDYTDAELAFDEISGQTLDKVAIIGGFGGRSDHMLSILFLLGRESKFVMIDERNYIEKIETPFVKKMMKIDFENTYVSLLPLCDCLDGITLTGFKYPLDNARILRSQTVGISNEIIAQEATIAIESGTGLLIFSKDTKA